jgi:anti-anti-sigma regulatory factor
MLRISVHDNGKLITMKLEGKLSDAWVKELKRCWQAVRSRPESRPVRVNLNGVSFVDERGKDLLAAMQWSGAQVVAADPFMRSVIEEIAERDSTRPGASGLPAA